MIAEIMDEKIEIRYKEESEIEAHYNQTPYQYVPKRSLKIVPNEYIDIGQGILELISELSEKD